MNGPHGTGDATVYVSQKPTEYGPHYTVSPPHSNDASTPISKKMYGDVRKNYSKIKTTLIQEFVILIPNIFYFIVGWKNTPRDSVQSVHNSILEKKKIA